MDDLLEFTGSINTINISKAEIIKGTFSEKEGKKELYCTASYDENGNILTIETDEHIKNYVYHEGDLLCIHVARPDKVPLYKVDYFREEGLLVRKTRTNEKGIIDEDEKFFYNSEDELIEKKSKTMTFQYTYENKLLTEERWHSEFSLNQIIKYEYTNDFLTEINHFSGDEVPGRKVEIKRESHGFITEELVYSPSGIIISHIKYSYPTIYKDNWLKRIKYVLHSQNRRKEAIEATYRDFKFFPNAVKVTEEKEEQEAEEITPSVSLTPTDQVPQELEFDNGLYRGEIVNGEMHGNGEFIFNTGTRYQGAFRNNSMEGRGKLTYTNGKVYEGTFYNNVLEGPGACKWENGDFYVGEFKNGKMHGKGCYIWKNGNRFEGLFADNKRSDQGILYKASELESTAPPEWVNDLFK